MPVAMDASERDRLAIETRERLFANQEAPSSAVTLAEATARSVKYYADYRLRSLEEALAGAQLDVARFDMLPRLMASAGYTTRNNDAFGFGFSPGGSVATNPSASQERDRNTFNLGFSWNILDFGVSYFKAKQSADQTLIARERRNKAIQILVHDVRRAWWRAEAAQRLLPGIDDLLMDVESALEKTRIIESRKLLPPTQIVSLRRALLELEQQISFRRQELAQARIELNALINVPPGTLVTLAGVKPESQRLLDLTADAERLEARALRSRPELAEEGYRARISEAEAKKGLLSALPNLTLDLGLNYDSNRFLVNNIWSSAGLSMAYNLVKVFSIPAINRSAEAQRQVDEARRMAVAMAIMTQTRIATVRYTLVAHEFDVWNEASRDDDQIVKLLSASAQVGIDTELELIRARARSMVSNINRDLSYANLEATIAQLYQSVGFDAVIDGQDKQSVADLTRDVEARFAEYQREVFSEPRIAPPIEVAMGPIAGVEPAAGALLLEGMNRVFDLSKVKMSDPAQAEFRIVLRAALQPPKSGSQAARLDMRVLEAAGGKERFNAEFKTTLSDPVDDEQLRVLGEGAAYRVLVWLAGGRTARMGTRLPAAAGGPGPAAALPDMVKMAETLNGEPLRLRVMWQLHTAYPMTVSSLESFPPVHKLNEAVQ